MNKLAGLIPDFIKPVLRPLYRFITSSHMYRSLLIWRRQPDSHPNLDSIHNYWRNPKDGNVPKSYIEWETRSQFLLEIMRRYAAPNAKILEIGCNVGRNLNFLFMNGFTNLEGIEISKDAVKLLEQTYPEMARHTKICNMPVEEIIGEFRDNKFDVVFTMATLEHVHTDSEWIFPEMVRTTRDVLVTIEDEYGGGGWTRFPRNYGKIFKSLGMKQVEELKCGYINGFTLNFFARIFKKM